MLEIRSTRLKITNTEIDMTEWEENKLSGYRRTIDETIVNRLYSVNNDIFFLGLIAIRLPRGNPILILTFIKQSIIS